MDLCIEIAAARKEVGLSQQGLADRLGVLREKLARLESGIGSVEFLAAVMAAIPVRVNGLAKGFTIIDQLKNCRTRRGWTLEHLARVSSLDARTVQGVEAGRGTVASLSEMLTALAPNASRQVHTRAFWDYDRAKTSASDSRFTPPEFTDALTDAFGPIALDPCGNALSTLRAERTIILPECGLAADWRTSGLVYVNSPFSDLAMWLRKANDEWEAGKIGKLAFLIPGSRLDVGEFHDRAARNATTLILHDRLRFGYPEHPSGKHPAPFSMCLSLWGCSAKAIDRFRVRWPALVLQPQDGFQERRFAG